MSATHMTVDLPKGFIVQAPPGKRFQEGEPVMVFRAQDALAPLVIENYIVHLEERFAHTDDPKYALQLVAAREKLNQFNDWQTANAELVKFPDYVK